MPRCQMRQRSFEVTKAQGPYRKPEELLSDGAESISISHEVTVKTV